MLHRVVMCVEVLHFNHDPCVARVSGDELEQTCVDVQQHRDVQVPTACDGVTPFCTALVVIVRVVHPSSGREKVSTVLTLYKDPEAAQCSVAGQRPVPSMATAPDTCPTSRSTALSARQPSSSRIGASSTDQVSDEPSCSTLASAGRRVRLSMTTSGEGSSGASSAALT